MFGWHIACHPQGALTVLAKITIKREHSISVMGVAAYHGMVCAVYSVRVSCAGRHVDAVTVTNNKEINIHDTITENEITTTHN
jgi:hypothetical protein